MGELLIDTDVFVDHLRGHRKISVDGDHVHCSVITRAELLAGRRGEIEPINLLLAPFTEIDVDRSIADRAGGLRRSTSMALPDALIAATALRDGLTLVTRNAKDFAAVPGPSIQQPTSQALGQTAATRSGGAKPQPRTVTRPRQRRGHVRGANGHNGTICARSEAIQAVWRAPSSRRSA